MKNKIVTSVLLFIFFISQFVHTPIVSSEEFQGKGSLEQQHLSDVVSVEESSSSSFEEYSTISDGDVLESSISEDVESMMDSSYEIINNTIDSVEDSFETFEESQSSNLKNVVETSIEQYATIISNDFVLWEDLTFQKEKAKSQEYFQQTLYVEKEFAFSDGLKVVSIKNNEDQILGYINPDSLFYSTDKGGMFIADSKFVTIISKDMDIWENLSLTNKIENGNDYYSKTLEVKGKYHHFDGSVYYSVYSNKGEWIGYINENGVQVATGEQGIYHNYEQYATLIGNYSIWDGFTWENSVDSIEYKNQTFIAKGIYYHFNGSNYLSIYDNTGDWIGYINEAGAILSSGDEGPYVPYDNYVTINGTYNFWNSFNWEKEISSSDYQNQTLHAKGIYYHFSGASYLSVYDNIGNWIGYINQEGTTLSLSEAGTFFEYDQYVSVLGTYDIWDSFNWLNATDSSIYLNQTLHAKGIYYHFNGSRYLSLYNNTGDWVGYINQEGVKEASGPQGVYEKYEKHVTIKSNKYEIWKNFSWSKKAVGNFSGKTYLAKGLYNHFNGSKYLSLYDADNSWIGYINENGTKIAHSQAEKYNKVQELLNNEYKNNNFGIYVKSLTDGSTAQMNSNQQFHAASTGKLPALYYTQKMISEKKIDGNYPFIYTDAINQIPNAYMRGGAGILQGQPYGKKYSLNTIMNWTAKYSDNQGTNFLAYYAANKYDATMKKEISRIMGRNWQSPFYVNAKDNAMMLEAIYHQGGKLITDLSKTIYDDQRIPKYLPVQVAHKIGDVDDLRHDAGIVYANQPYILSVLTKNYQTYEEISILSKKIYDILK